MTRRKLSVGDWVEVRSKEEILRTLDSNGQLDGMPFMPEMFAFCGKRFEVYKRAHKTCDTVFPTRGRRVARTVHFETRCDGHAHGGCQAECLIFWKEAWLKPVSRNTLDEARARVQERVAHFSVVPAFECTEAHVRACTQVSDPNDGAPTYACQATQLPFATTSLAWWDIRQYVEDYWSGNVGFWRVLCGLVYSLYYNLCQAGIGVGPAMRWFYDKCHPLWRGTQFPRKGGPIPKGQPTPTATLNLQPGELVRVKSHEEILRTLNVDSMNRGMYWDAELVPYCGGTYRVLKRVTKIIDEKTGKMQKIRNPCIILDSVVCQARYSNCRMFCPRSIYSYWREIWLERVEPSMSGTVDSKTADNPNYSSMHTVAFCGSLLDAQPIRLCSENPRWFEWHGKATVLITSAEHYGAVLNLDFDFRRYLEAMQNDGMNYTRIFAGSYVEPQGAFGIKRNTLAPMSGRFIAPWVRSDKRGYAGGGNRFDLDRFSADYLARLKDFISEAGRRGIVVELTLFCSVYSDQQWRVHPFNPVNNIQGIKFQDWKNLNTSANGPAIMGVQEKFVRWLVRELNGFDNLFYEIQNEPWVDNHMLGDFINPYMTDHYRWPNAVELATSESVAWQRVIAHIITDEESHLPKQHLIAQNVANFRLAVRDEDLVSEASIINFHYAYPEAVDWNRGLNRVIGCDETGCVGRRDVTYQQQAWNFIFSGGALFNNLDFSFTVGYEDGQDLTNQAPGGGGPTLRRQLQVLSDFLHGLDLAKMNPDQVTVQQAPGVVVRGLSEPGRQYAFYLYGRGPTSLKLSLPAGTYEVQWIEVDTGRLSARRVFQAHNDFTELQSPEFKDVTALQIIRQ